jgi:hypothetical protein
MKRFVIDDATQTIVNVIVVDPQSLPDVGEGYSLSETGGNIGDVLINGKWVTPQPDPAETLAAWRETADMDKGAFCIGLMRAGVLPPQEAVAASKGEWPATFASAVSNLPIDPDEAQIIWASTARVRRLHPILLALIPLSPLTDADVDAMFGWSD